MSTSAAHASAGGLFAPVLDEHLALESLFLDQQVALMALDLPAALAALQDFEGLLGRHMAFEEEQLMPAWDAAGGNKERLGPGLLADEHQKLLARLATLRAALTELAARASLELRDIIELLDEELRFKRLLHHHDERERLGLYPFLEDGLGAPQLERLRGEVTRYLSPSSNA